MMHALLKDRFNPDVHHESGTLQGFALVPGKNGFKFNPTENVGGHSTNVNNGRISTERTSLSQFADLLARQLNQPAADMTGIKGVFNIAMEYSPDPGTDDSGPSIVTGLREQLGLKIEGRMVPVDILVKDHVEKTPTDN
jgi:uncharacterized protein (TIGR03435 family)